ncbi:MAG: hypothetical protein ACTH9F_05565 [Brachybacterium tyrofermentans]
MPQFPRPEAISAHLDVAHLVHGQDWQRAHDAMAAMMGELRGDLFGA